MKLTLYYDGACQLCSREIRYYYGLPGAKERITLVDIAGPDFDAGATGLDPAAVNQVLHVKLPGGEVRTGVDAFVALWQALPQCRWLARLARVPLFNSFLRFGYRGFAKVRPLLPKRKTTCSLS
jgi:predicted DCC family thiol-disulfide oxidoreductase YuxK